MIYPFLDLNREKVSGLHTDIAHGVSSPFSDPVGAEINSGAAGLSSEADKLRMFNSVLHRILSGQLQYGFAFRCFICHRTQYSSADKGFFPNARSSVKVGSLAVTDGNSSRFIQQQYIYISGSFYSTSALGNHIGPQSTVHARNTNGREQTADSSRYKADK
ncbi:hypothetical protein D3C72_716910 [compost metagenome]